jgi:hypothetical protein
VKGKLIWSIFWAMVGVFVIVASMLFIPALNGLVGWWGVLGILFALAGLGVALIVLTVKTKVRGMLKGFLLLTGASVVGLLVCGILHNVVSALLHTEEAVFFMMAVFVCPIGFLVGVGGTIVLVIKNRPLKHSGQKV